MAQIGDTDFRMKPDVNMAAIASLFQKQATDQQTMAAQQSTMESQQQDRVMNVMKMATDMTQNLIVNSQRNLMQASAGHVADALGMITSQAGGKEGTATLFSHNTMPAAFNTQEVPTSGTTQVPFSQTPEGTQYIQQQLLKGMPQQTQEALINQQFPKAPTTTDQLLAASLMNGNQGMANQVTNAKQQMALSPATQKSNALVDGKPTMINYVPKRGGVGDYYDTQGNKLDGSRLAPIPSSGEALASIRLKGLVNTMNQQLPQKMNPEFWSGNSQAAISARLVNNAESAKILANQILSGQVPGNKQTMSILQTDAARVVAQQGVITNEGRDELQNKTGYSQFADALQYFTNHPEDRKANAFIGVLKNEMQRQQDFRQRQVDVTQKGLLPSFNELKRTSPQDWEQGLDANGIDVNAAKQGHFKLKNERSDFSGLAANETQSPNGALKPTMRYNPDTGKVEAL